MQTRSLTLRKVTGHPQAKDASRLIYDDIKVGEVGPALFRQARKIGLGSIVSKHRDRAYRAGRSANWIKTKNPKEP